ncbi:MAG TPA: putative toxin-antitoxin system toxin component, PIN family [Gammaproteobacteria bacterium]|nr:putative toxin-antitoxin system toxin component, PIN family [Gammaproteobacteria bacterium]
MNKVTMQELYRVLSYPKFALSESDREELLRDYLPFAELVKMPARLPNLSKCRDPHDQKFIELAAVAKADMLVTGDRDLLALTGKLQFSICSVVELQAHLEASGQSRGP